MHICINKHMRQRKWNIKIRQQYCILANLVLNEYKDLIQQKEKQTSSKEI